ncbi:flagellar basal-body MS-ring/collar protein FliF [Nocardioides kribbensis]|uniref:flagellar basal-body MS-ring/collar protein FliF n=1 Tax=Nocardioides kribbensis TaxID=305517 RepID=UPI00187997D8|nr:flagellar basal-body MS-ring/collar protein FliF [Nocardioides kribbensis]
MKDTITRTLGGWRQSFAGFTAGQKVVAIVGTLALLLGGFLVFRWASAPTYSPLYSDLSASDASAVVEQLDSQGVPYELADGGATVMVPRDAVYKARIDLSGEGLPSESDGGYSILDDNGLSTSEFQEQTDYKRAMEGELSATIEGIDEVDTAVVHLAMPAKDVFADEQDPPTASVLVETGAGTRLGAQQVQAIVHLVASSVEGLDPADVTVSDTEGLLSGADGTGVDATTRNQEIEARQEELRQDIQATLDRVVGPGNSTVQVAVDLDFDKRTTQTTTFTPEEDNPATSSSTSTETYTGPGSPTGGAEGVVGPDGQMDTGATGGSADSSYEKEVTTTDRAVGSTVEHVESTPGSVESMHVGVVLDTNSTQAISTADVRGLVEDAVGLDQAAGDSVRVVTMPFDRTAEEAAAAELEAAAAADASAARNDLIRKVGLALLVALVLLLAVLKGRKRAKQREQATTYVVEQLREQSAARQLTEPVPAALALEESERSEENDMRDELNALIERQPEDVAALLRGWLTERG